MADLKSNQPKAMEDSSKCVLKLILAEDTRTTEDVNKTRYIVETFLGVHTQTSTAYGKNRKDFKYDIDDSASEAWSGAAQGSSSSPQDRRKVAVEPYQLQLWVYETKDGSMTLAEKLEKRIWECVKH